MSHKHKILSMHKLPFGSDVFNILNGLADIRHEEPDQENLIRLIPDYDIYLCSLRVRVSKEAIDAGKKLKAIFTPSTGTDHIDTEYAYSKGIKIISAKNDYEYLKNITATAELAWALLLCSIRRIPWAFDSVKSGFWSRDDFRGHQLSGKTFGVLGFGRLGEIVADYAKAFRMNVLACDKKGITADNVFQVNFETLMKESDIISIHVHLTPENIHLIDKPAFDKMKNGVVLINTSRGAIINEDALLEALITGKVAAAGLDIVHGEWNYNIGNHPLIEYAKNHDNLIITPHIGGVTFESQKMALEHIIRKIYDYLKDRENT